MPLHPIGIIRLGLLSGPPDLFPTPTPGGKIPRETREGHLQKTVALMFTDVGQPPWRRSRAAAIPRRVASRCRFRSNSSSARMKEPNKESVDEEPTVSVTDVTVTPDSSSTDTIVWNSRIFRLSRERFHTSTVSTRSGDLASARSTSRAGREPEPSLASSSASSSPPSTYQPTISSPFAWVINVNYSCRPTTITFASSPPVGSCQLRSADGLGLL